MSDKLREQTGLEREQLRRLIEVHRPLLNRCAATSPDAIELSALAVMLHSFYNGIENILKRVAVGFDSFVPTGESWHKQILDAMAQATPLREAVLSQELRVRLQDYLEFRHLFRHSYVFDLRWEKLSVLALGCEETLRLIESELDRFWQS